ASPSPSSASTTNARVDHLYGDARHTSGASPSVPPADVIVRAAKKETPEKCGKTSTPEVVERCPTWNTGMGGKGRWTVRRRLTSSAGQSRFRRALACVALATLVVSPATSYAATTSDVAGAAPAMSSDARVAAANPRGPVLGVIPSRPPAASPSYYSTSS